jgi:hypothetical protein
MADVIVEEGSTNHQLYDKWTLWAHLPHDTDWTLGSYKQIFNFESVEQAITLTETLPEKLIKNCMLFIMRDGIQPTWEDERNTSGGCFSYKINNKFVKEAWAGLTYRLVGETITNDTGISNIVNGITISPKKNFCIIKIWTNTCKHQTATIIKPLKELIISQGCLFKKHKP